ncbi:hypothetical protein ACA910_015060 [Epithemia clementina (nom. ined.)]
MIRSLDSAAYHHVSSRQFFLSNGRYPSEGVASSWSRQSGTLSNRSLLSSNESIDTSSSNTNINNLKSQNDSTGPFRKLRRIKRRLFLEAAQDATPSSSSRTLKTTPSGRRVTWITSSSSTNSTSRALNNLDEDVLRTKHHSARRRSNSFSSMSDDNDNQY